MRHYRIAHLITMNPSVIYFYTYQYFCHKLVFLANQLISWESSKELYGQKLKNHKDDSDLLFPLQYNLSMKSLGEPFTTKVIWQSMATSMSKCGVTFRYLKKKTHERNPTNRLDSILGPFVKGKE